MKKAKMSHWIWLPTYVITLLSIGYVTFIIVTLPALLKDWQSANGLQILELNSLDITFTVLLYIALAPATSYIRTRAEFGPFGWKSVLYDRYVLTWGLMVLASIVSMAGNVAGWLGIKLLSSIAPRADTYAVLLTIQPLRAILGTTTYFVVHIIIVDKLLNRQRGFQKLKPQETTSTFLRLLTRGFWWEVGGLLFICVILWGLGVVSLLSFSIPELRWIYVAFISIFNGCSIIILAVFSERIKTGMFPNFNEASGANFLKRLWRGKWASITLIEPIGFGIAVFIEASLHLPNLGNGNLLAQGSISLAANVLFILVDLPRIFEAGAHERHVDTHTLTSLLNSFSQARPDQAVEFLNKNKTTLIEITKTLKTQHEQITFLLFTSTMWEKYHDLRQKFEDKKEKDYYAVLHFLLLENKVTFVELLQELLKNEQDGVMKLLSSSSLLRYHATTLASPAAEKIFTGKIMPPIQESGDTNMHHKARWIWALIIVIIAIIGFWKKKGGKK